MNVILYPLTGDVADRFLKDWKSSSINMSAFDDCKELIDKIKQEGEDK